MSNSIAAATDVYKTVSRGNIHRHRVDHLHLFNFTRSLYALERSLGEDIEDDFWYQPLRSLRILGFTFCSTPIPFSAAVSAMGFDWNRVDKQVRLSQSLFPDAYDKFQGVVNQLREISRGNESPFIKVLENLNENVDEVCVVLRPNRLNEQVQSFFDNSESLVGTIVLSPNQMKSNTIYRTLVTVGRTGWFPEHIFSAPRARDIHVVTLKWIIDDWKPGPLLLHDQSEDVNDQGNHFLGKLPFVNDEAVHKADLDPEHYAIHLMPPKPPNPAHHSSHGNNSAIHHSETTPAHLCYLSGEKAVYIPSDDTSKTLIIDMSESGDGSVRRVLNCNLQGGDYLLLRTSGGGDLIAPVADYLMGGNAQTCRFQQAEWKEIVLSEATRKFGNLSRIELASKISSNLDSEKIAAANPINILYWLSSGSIRPRSQADFNAILSFAGLQERVKEFWDAMGKIDHAHRQAGFAIRKMLLEKIQLTSLDALARDGEMEFDLGGAGGGSLTAYQILSVDSTGCEVLSEEIGLLMDLEI